MLGIGKEISIFISACLSGNFICLIYFGVQLFRRLTIHNLFWISVEDFIFWIFVGVYLFLEMYRTCSGNIRWYFVLGIVSGGVLTLWIREKIKKRIDKSHKKR